MKGKTGVRRLGCGRWVPDTQSKSRTSSWQKSQPFPPVFAPNVLIIKTRFSLKCQISQDLIPNDKSE